MQTISSICSGARKRGYRREVDMAAWLKMKYIKETFKIEYKQVFDIYHDKILIDSVGIDERGRLITGHKRKCKAHRMQAHKLNRRGYIGFMYNGKYYFLSVESTILKRNLRPKVNNKLLSACICDPLGNRKINPDDMNGTEYFKYLLESGERLFIYIPTTPTTAPITAPPVRTRKAIVYGRDRYGKSQHRVIDQPY